MIGLKQEKILNFEDFVKIHIIKKPKLNCVREALERMIKGCSNLRIELSPSGMVMTNSEGIDQLSGGYKAVIF